MASHTNDAAQPVFGARAVVDGVQEAKVKILFATNRTLRRRDLPEVTMDDLHWQFTPDGIKGWIRVDNPLLVNH